MTTKTIVTGPQLLSFTSDVNVELGATNQRRLARFVELESDSEGRFAFSTVFENLFAGKSSDKAMSSFKKFRQDVNEAAESANCSLRLVSNRKGGSDLSARKCWLKLT